jgi:hypothetical protein
VTSQLLTAPSDLESYWALCHHVLCLQKKWSFDERNALGLRLEPSGGVPGHRLLMRDRLDPVAHVVGSFDASGNMVGGLRLLVSDSAKLEVEHTHPLPQRFKPSYLRKAEVSRMVVLNDAAVDQTKVVHDLMQCVADLVRQHECDLLLLAAHEPEPASNLRRLGFVTSEQQTFRGVFREAPLLRLLHLDCRVKESLEALSGSSGTRRAA